MQKKYSKVAGLALLVCVLVASPPLAVATEYQQCTIGETCAVGEFLYDDEYVPVTDATCTLTSRDPDGNLFLNSVSMTAASDGWYSYDVTTTGEDAGTYRSQVCCTSGSEYLCLDKTYELVAASSGSSLSAADVWSYSSRSLTSFGDLVDDIWNRSSRTLTGAGISGNNLATQGSNGGVDLTTLNTSIENISTSINSLSAQVTQNQTLISQLDSQVTNNYLTNISNETVETLTISLSQLETISAETNNITSLLEDSEYYDEALSIQQEINNSIETINQLQSVDSDDPATVIENYQKATSELASVITRLGNLQDLLIASKSISRDTQTIRSAANQIGWVGVGLILLIVTVGLIFLIAYLRILLLKKKMALKTKRVAVEKEVHDEKDQGGSLHAPALPHKVMGWSRLFFIILTTGSVSALISGGLIVGLSRAERGSDKKPEPVMEAGLEPMADEDIEQELAATESATQEVAIKEAEEPVVLGLTGPGTVTIDEGNRANVRAEPKAGARIIDQLYNGHQFSPLEETDNWLKIEFENGGETKIGWISRSLVSY
jgi:hypothetical protein